MTQAHTQTVTWSIGQLDRNAADGGVTTAHWRVSATDGESIAEAYGAVRLTPDPSSPGFTPYESLTESDVLGWVWSAVAKDKVESALKDQLEARKNPTTVTGTPW